jgi:hypothetical protein
MSTVIVQLHKDASAEDKDKFIEELKANGAEVVKDENKGSAGESHQMIP